MMKRAGLARLSAPDDPGMGSQQSVNTIQQHQQQPSVSNMHTLAQSAQQPSLGNIGTSSHVSVVSGSAAMLSVGGSGIVRGVNVRSQGAPPAVINYLKPTQVQYAAPKPQQPQLARHKPLGSQSPSSAVPVQVSISSGGPPNTGPPVSVAPGGPQTPGATQFQRLKVEDALSYLDQVKFKFNSQPQVYNDFLDIMKEFKSQSIDTPGVIQRVSNLFKGHPELIVGFNTFLPPGYKIEVQSNGQGVAYQVSVSMPSPTSQSGASAGPGLGPGVLLAAPHHHTAQPLPPQPQPQLQPQLVHILPPTVQQSVGGAIVHNLSVSTAASNTLHHISQAHQQIEAAAAAAQHHASAGGVITGGAPTHPPVAPAGQPVEFNHAIEYVNKIKSRFQRQPDKYKRFLEILHAYQRGHRELKEAPQIKQQTEQEVYSQVAKLFENQDDLLAEFGQFLPDASAGKGLPGVQGAGQPVPVVKSVHYVNVQAPVAHETHPQQRAREQPDIESEISRYIPAPVPRASPPHVHVPHQQQTASKHASALTSTSGPAPQQHPHLKRSPSFSSSTQLAGTGAPPPKKPRTVLTGAAVRDVSYAEAAKYGTLADFSFFDRVRKALRSQEVYDNFLRCLLLFTNEVISSSELVAVTAPFFARHPELHKLLLDLVGPPAAVVDQAVQSESGSGSYNSLPYLSNASGLDRERLGSELRHSRYEPLGAPGAQYRHDRPQGDAAMDVDLSTAKRLGFSYCALPRGSAESAARRCSGRTPLCREVLNDTWVSFPSWSEDSTFVTSRKTQFEEYIYRCEDERFELDVVIETNASTIRVLEGVQKKMSRMTSEDLSKFRLDDCLGGTSPTIHQRALRRIYGDKVATDIIAGLKKNPQVAVPVVLRRLKAKEEEWREAQKGFNKQWREQNEKYYLKSLDHQGINFKQNDLKALRSKSLFSDVESAFNAGKVGPHLTVDYGIKGRQEGIKILRDATELLIHHARRQTGIQKTEKRRIKRLLRQFVPDLFDHPRLPASDDEREDAEEKEEGSSSPAQDENTSGVANRPTNSSPTNIKQEKHEASSESDTNTSDRGNRSRNKDLHKTNHSTDNNNTKETNSGSSGASKRSDSSNCDEPMKTDVKSDLRSEVKSELAEEEDIRSAPSNEARFVCTSSWYLFLRLHGVLCQRLCEARRAALALAEQEARDQRTRPPSVAVALRLKSNSLGPPSEYYNKLLDLVRAVLDGNTEPTAYEDGVREMLGIRAYPAYTLDKIVSYAVRQLQHCVSDLLSVKASELAARGGMRGGASYVRRARRCLRAEQGATLVRVYGGEECRATYQLLQGGRREEEEAPCQGPNDNPNHICRLGSWSLYAERYVRPTDTGEETTLARNKPVLLRRNVRRCGGGGDVAVAASTRADYVRAGHARRKKILDTGECTLAGRLRLLSSRPTHLYRPGALRAARNTCERLHSLRKEKFRAWHRRYMSAYAPGVKLQDRLC